MTDTIRIICPQCEAAYDIPAAAISGRGREVQCSACAHSWYQLTHAVVPPRSTPPPPVDTPQMQESTHVQREVDPEVLEVLREEAAREAQARKSSPPAPLETQPDLGLVIPPRPKESVRDRLERLKAAERARDSREWNTGEESDPGSVIEAPERPIEPVTPRLHRRSDPGLPVAVSKQELAIIRERKERRDFRIGFAIPVLACLIALALYLGAPLIAGHAPQADPFLSVISEHGETLQSAISEHARKALASFEQVQSRLIGADG
ncbi:zinc-ribbon domain-containing protein [Qingshengfaniella alkalisoli]|uniref:Zinc finger/thioredoxin putative domain-containing protein n=1 Tax=Qingshengfaniella alkalisoli TaxID=2599296 RepID=A0A5B8ISL9_9RHOB|nr:zinc-ribbon domain-containing protein [Qingshengfaniella alkalisoli]QDY68594.1 hypothetical protein FPZ52_02475 [Qingshengfaniella alkalisoli]